MKPLIQFALFLLLAQGAAAQNTSVEKTAMVGGAPMYPSKNIIENLGNSKDHSTLVSLIKAADLSETLQSIGPFTLFAPTNAAFNKLTKGTVDGLLLPENKGQLSGIITYHLLSGKLDSKALMAEIDKGKGRAELLTVNGAKLTATAKDGKITITDERSGAAMIIIKDVYQSNGVIHVVDTVLMPK